MIRVSDIEDIRLAVSGIFPDAVRGSVAKSHWGRGQKQLHLHYWFHSDTAGGAYIIPVRGMYCFVEWDTNEGAEYKWAESSMRNVIARLLKEYQGSRHKIMRPVNMGVSP